MNVIRLAEVTSTQEVARGLAVGSVVVADHQRAGRGRLGRRWEAPPGSGLAASFVVAPRPLLSLAAGVAAAEACGDRVRLKWPNDLLLEGRKLGGILVEVTGGVALVGVGINLTWAPPTGASMATDRDQLLEGLIGALGRWLAAPDAAVLERWRELSDTLGGRVRVELGSEVVEGLAEDIAPDGALIVDGRPLAAGDVIHLRLPSPAAEAAPRPSGLE
ncbi:MAG TPA: biotin--[acetyl-CoA-carboxylase] ligase [Candidatus Dormibacteraeota bacterium]